MIVGFVILSHNHPQQVLRLVSFLDRVYGRPPIAIHHDTHQSPIDVFDFPDWVSFVENPERTRWAQFSVVRGALKALALLYSKSKPDWFFLLSGADYPIRAAHDVFSYLSNLKADALVDYRDVPDLDSNTPVEPPANPALAHFTAPGNGRLAFQWYVGLNLWFPILRPGPRIGRRTIYTSIRHWPLNLKPYYGDHWIAGNARVADVLLHPTAEHKRLRRHLRLRTVPEECYYQTVLANEASLKIERDTKRFAKWMGGGAHPRNLELSDLPLILNSGAFFARKFTPDAPVLDAIDDTLRGTNDNRLELCEQRSGQDRGYR